MFFVWLAMFVLGLILVVKGPRLVGLLMCSPYLTPIILINLLASPDNYDSVEYWCSIISWVMAIVAMLYVVFRLVASTPAATLVASIPVATDEDQQMVNTLIELASYYASGGLSRDNPQLVDEAMQIGRHLLSFAKVM